jgi:ribose 5-phosphate isomerase B
MVLLKDLGHEYHDFGCYTEESVDYPDIAGDVGKAVAGGDYDLGVLICNTGIGMSIAGNKVKGIRAALCYDPFTAERARQHNNANVLCLGTIQKIDDIADIVKIFLITEFEGGRHLRRVNKIMGLES